MTHSPLPLEPMGFATVATDMEAARSFYTRLYPHPVTDGNFAGIPLFSIIKDGVALVSVFQRTPGTPLVGTTPVLKVDHVGHALEGFAPLGVKVLVGESLCPCTQTHFALCADAEGNQFIVKEHTPR